MARAKTLSKRLKLMATKKRATRRRRRKSTTLSAAPKRRRTSTRRRRRTTRALSTGAASPRKMSITQSLMASAAGGLGGGLYLVPKLVLKNMPVWQKVLLGIGGSVALNMAKQPNVAAGFSGAMVADVARSMFPTLLNDDDDLQDTEWVDPNSLSDSGHVDEYGNPVLMSDTGTAYALNENNELEEIGEGTDLQSVSMLPLQDAYSLNDPYSLNDRFAI